MAAGTSIAGRQRSRALGALLAGCAALAVAAPQAAALSDAEELARFGSEGHAAGQLGLPGNSAADPRTGHVYFTDGAGDHNRIDEFTPWGEFVKAVGFDVAPGAVNETQEVRVRAAEGAFKLGLEGEESADLRFDASGAEVKAALEALPALASGGGEVAVDARPGNPATATPSVYAIAFKGSLASADVAQLTVEDGDPPLGGGSPTTSAEVRTRAEGHPPSAGLEACTAESGCQAGLAGEGAGQLRNAGSIALGPAGEVFVRELTGRNNRVQKLSPSGRFELMFGGEVNKTKTEEGASEAERNLCTAADLEAGDLCGAGTAGGGEGQFNGGTEIALDPSGTLLYAAGLERIQKFNLGGEQEGEVPDPGGLLAGERVGSLAADPVSGDLYFTFGGNKEDVHRLDPATGEEVGEAREAWLPSRLATGPGGELYAIEARLNQENATSREEEPHPQRVLEFDPEGDLVSIFAVPELLPGSNNDRYQLRGIGTGPAGDLYVSNASTAGEGAFVRAFGPPPIAYEAPPRRPPQIAAQYAVSATGTEAELRAEINPRFWDDTTYYLQYGTSPCSQGGCASKPLPPGAKLTAQVIDAPQRSAVVALTGLEPATTYHYRFLAQSSGGGPVYGEGGGEATEGGRFREVGAEGTFRTFAATAQGSCANEALRTGPAAELPDCRAYELVSPPEKANGDVIVLGEALTSLPASLDQSSASGSKLAYGAYRSFGDAASGSFTSQYIAARTEGGWQSHGISPPRTSPVVPLFDQSDTEFRAFSPDLCEAWLGSFAEPKLAPAAVAGYSNLYRRVDQGCGGGPDYEALSTAEPPSVQSGGELGLELQGVADDRSHVIYAAKDSLPGSGAPAQPPGCEPKGAGCRFALYAQAEAEPGPRFVCFLPSGEASKDPCAAGDGLTGGKYRSARLDNALSADGQRIYWTAGNRIYLRENPTRPQSALEHGAATGTGTLTEGSTKVSLLVAAQGEASFTAGSEEATLQEVSVGRFVEGQPLISKQLPAGTEVLAVSPDGSTLTLSAPATATATAPIASQGPMPFAPGQQISGPGIPLGTTIAAVAEGSLTLSQAATASAEGAALQATSECTEPADACTLAVSASGEAQSARAGATYWGAAADGSRAIFAVGGDLYEFDAEAEATRPIAGGVQGLLGMSEDGRRIYLASTEALPGAGQNSEGAEAIAGEANLYLHRAPAGGGGEGSFAFIATLSDQDIGGFGSPLAREPRFHTSRVAPDGRHAAFTSFASPTGYDNLDASTGEPVAEAYLYDASAGELRCASCHPSGARPHGALGEVSGHSLRAAALIPVPENTLYASRALADDGSRLFFEAADTLSPRDSNGHRDVYQWEAPGRGDCTTASPGYAPANGGCVELISSGLGARDARLIDASPSGEDVFFATLSSLLPSDYGLVDIYDARVGGGFPPPPAPPAACEGEACQSPPAAPEGPAPASEAFRGPGNVAGGAASACAAPARRAKRLSAAAGRARRAAGRIARSHSPRRAQRTRRKARRLARQARRQSKRAKRCRRAQAP